MRIYTRLFTKIFFVALLLVFLSGTSQAQFREGAWGLNAGMSMPSGLTLSAGIPTSTLVNVSFTYSFSSSFAYVLSQNLQLEAGISYLTASFQVPSGATAPDNQNLFSIYAGGKYFLMQKEMVMPYIGAGLSYSSLPTVKSGNSNETSGSLLTFIGCFGVQSFLNKEKTVSLFIQIGVGFNKGTVSSKTSGGTYESGQTNINLGGSAFGGTIYF